MRNKYIILAGLAILLSYAVYFIRFFLFDGQVLSASAEHWGQFGDFVGGVINPIIGFLTVVILVRQNYELTMEMDRSKRSDYTREFDTIFFNGLDRQKRVFDNFSINFSENNDCQEFFGSAEVVKIEDLISSMRNEGASVSDVRVKIEDIDADNFDKLFEIVRAFYILAVMVGGSVVKYVFPNALAWVIIDLAVLGIGYLILRKDRFVDMRHSMIFLGGLTGINVLVDLGIMGGMMGNIALLALLGWMVFGGGRR